MQLATAAFFAIVQMMGPLASPATAPPAPPPPTPATPVTAPPAPVAPPATVAPAAPPAAAAALDPKLEAVVDAIQKTYEGTREFRGKFQQKFTYTMLRRTQESKGTVTFEKPGRMRWDYAATDGKSTEKSFIVDGKSLWLVQPRDKVAFVNACFQQDGLTASVAFLWGEGKLREQFTISWFDGQFGDKTDHHLLLLPKENNSIFARLILVVDPTSSRVKQSVVVDPAGNVNQFLFSELQFNKGVEKGVFTYKPTAGINAARMPGSCDAPVAGVK